jgi:hypothetical protein
VLRSLAQASRLSSGRLFEARLNARALKDFYKPGKLKNKDMGMRLDLGGVEGDRTLDLRIANATLSQLSYHPGIADCRARILP